MATVFRFGRVLTFLAFTLYPYGTWTALQTPSSDSIGLTASFEGIGDEAGPSPDTMIAAGDASVVVVRNGGRAIR